jgi:hypothetical protein
VLVAIVVPPCEYYHCQAPIAKAMFATAAQPISQSHMINTKVSISTMKGKLRFSVTFVKSLVKEEVATKLYIGCKVKSNLSHLIQVNTFNFTLCRVYLYAGYFMVRGE